MSYPFSKILNKQSFKIDSYEVIALRKEDIFDIMDWRNAQISVLRQAKQLTQSDQLNYFENVVEKTFEISNPSVLLFSFLHLNKCIGYGGLTNINWIDKRVELSFLLNPSRVADDKQYVSDFTHFIQLMKIITFDELKFNRIFTETYDLRPLHILILEKCNFNLEGRMKEHVFIEDNFVDSLIHGCLKKEYES